MKRRWRKLAIILGVLLCLYVAYRLTLHFKVEAKLNEIRKQGYPVTLAELDKWYPQVPAGENAADVYLKAFSKISTNSESTTSLPVVGKEALPPRDVPLDAKTRQRILDYLGENAEALSLLHNGARLKECRFPQVLTNGMLAAVASSKWAIVRKGVRLLELEVLARIEAGESEEAVESWLALLTLSRSVRHEPFLIGYLVEVAYRRNAYLALERLLTRRVLTESQVSQITTALLPVERPDALMQTLVSERCFGSDSFREVDALVKSYKEMPDYVREAMKSFPSERLLLSALFPLYRATGLVEWDHIAFLEGMDFFVQASQRDYPERFQAYREAALHAEGLPKLRIMARSALDGLQRIAVKDAEAIARLRAMQTALVVEQSRNKTGALPEKLVDPIPADPFDGQPLRYKKLAKGYVVYSVGEDGKDDGGDEKKDITFTVER